MGSLKAEGIKQEETLLSSNLVKEFKEKSLGCEGEDELELLTGKLGCPQQLTVFFKFPKQGGSVQEAKTPSHFPPDTTGPAGCHKVNFLIAKRVT